MLSDQQLLLSLAFITAGVSLVMGLIGLSVGAHQKDKNHLMLGAMGLSLFFFLLLPPAGFIIHDSVPYPATLVAKRFFIFGYYGLMPWFILSYTEYPKKNWAFGISALVAITFAAMALTQTLQPIWPFFALIAFGLILCFGVVAGLYLYKTERGKAWWLFVALSVFGFLFIATVANQISQTIIENVFGVKFFFSIHTHALFLMLILGMQIVHELKEKKKLEKVLDKQNARWQIFMNHAQVVIMELSESGEILYINPYGIKLLGYFQANDLLGKNWFGLFFTDGQAKARKNLFDQLIAGKPTDPYFKISLRNRIGIEITIDWMHYAITGEKDDAPTLMCIGRDTTEAETANKTIAQLKLEIAKETILLEKPNTDYTGGLIGTSEAIKYAIQKAKQVAPTQAVVLLEGETGVGKEMLADLIHQLSSRSDKPMIKVNCGALPKELIEDELFGHERGAFTSAIQPRKGRFELADGGTLFLDEIGELPLEVQPKLLRVLQKGEFERIGSQKTTTVDVRIIAATNRNLSMEVKAFRFRDDLYYRLSVFPITIPPLRKRKEDMPVLIDHFVRSKSNEYGKTFNQISKADLNRLIEHTWPGNVRELKNVIERSVIESDGATLKVNWLWEEPQTIGEQALEHIERDHILKTLESCSWKINGESGAAQKLAMNPNTLRSKMKKLGITRPVSNLP